MGYDASFERLPINACFDLKGTESALVEWIGAEILPSFPAEANRSRRVDGLSLDYVGPCHWLLQAGIDREDELSVALRPHLAPADVSIVRISDTVATFRVTGADATHILAIGCPLDLHETAFPDDAVSFTEFFGQKALIRRCAGGFDVSVERSFGDMMEDFLIRALR